MKETYLVIHLFSGTMVISDENEREGCRYAEVSGLDTKKRQPEKVTVACPVFPLPHDRFTAVSALAATAQRDAGRLCECCRYAGPFRYGSSWRTMLTGISLQLLPVVLLSFIGEEKQVLFPLLPIGAIDSANTLLAQQQSGFPLFAVIPMLYLFSTLLLLFTAIYGFVRHRLR